MPVQAIVRLVGVLSGAVDAVFTLRVTFAPWDTVATCTPLTVAPSVGATGQRPGVA